VDDHKPQIAPKETLPDGLRTTEQAAEFLSISTETLRRLCRKKAISFIKVTNSEYRFRKGDLDEYIASRNNRRKSVSNKLRRLVYR
jgi:excisionase family DNA binding protein